MKGEPAARLRVQRLLDVWLAGYKVGDVFTALDYSRKRGKSTWSLHSSLATMKRWGYLQPLGTLTTKGRPWVWEVMFITPIHKHVISIVDSYLKMSLAYRSSNSHMLRAIPEDAPPLAHAARAARLRLGLSQVEIDTIGLVGRRISSIESGRHTPTLDAIVSLTNMLELRIDPFLPEKFRWTVRTWEQARRERLQQPEHERRELTRELTLCLQELGDRDGDLLLKRFIQGMTLHEVGEIYGVTREAIRLAEGRALERVRKSPRFKHLRELREKGITPAPASWPAMG